MIFSTTFREHSDTALLLNVFQCVIHYVGKMASNNDEDRIEYLKENNLNARNRVGGIVTKICGKNQP